MRSKDHPPAQRQPSFLTDPTTSRDIFGVCRGRCTACSDCGRYLKATSDYTVPAGDTSRRHPDNDVGITRCSRCGCPPEAHEAVEHEQEREAGNEAFALGQWDAAVRHYSRAIELLNPAGDAALYSNRAAAYLAKGWPQQALHDAERALSLRPDWAKAWGRKGSALLQMGRASEAGEAYQRGLQLDGTSGAMQQGLTQARQALRKQQQQQEQEKRQREQQQRQREQQQQQQQGAVHKPHVQPPPPLAGQHAQPADLPVAAQPCTAAVASSPGSAPSRFPANTTPPAAAHALLPAFRGLQEQAAAVLASAADLEQRVRNFERLLVLAGAVPATEHGRPDDAAEHCLEQQQEEGELIQQQEQQKHPGHQHEQQQQQQQQREGGPGSEPGGAGGQHAGAAVLGGAAAEEEEAAEEAEEEEEGFAEVLRKSPASSEKDEEGQSSDRGEADLTGPGGRCAGGQARWEAPVQAGQDGSSSPGGSVDGSRHSRRSSSFSRGRTRQRSWGYSLGGSAATANGGWSQDASQGRSSSSRSSSRSSSGSGSSESSTSRRRGYARSSSGAGSSGAAGSSDSEDIEEVYSEVPDQLPKKAPAPASSTAQLSTKPKPPLTASSAAQMSASAAAAAPAAATVVPHAGNSGSDAAGTASAGHGIAGPTGNGGAATANGIGSTSGGSMASRSTASTSSGTSSGSTDDSNDSGSTDDSKSSDAEGSEGEAGGSGGRGGSGTAWLEAVSAAQRQLAAAGERVAPPGKSGRRPPKSAQAAVGGAGSGAGSLGLGSLWQMCAAAEAAALARDEGGVPRAACRQCGHDACPRYRAPAHDAGDASALEALLLRAHDWDTGMAGSRPSLNGGSLCAVCGCPSSAHETGKEAAAREARQRRQELRQQRQQQQQQQKPGTGAATGVAASNGGHVGAEALDERQQRVAAAAQRRAAAEAAGELLQESDCDTLSQARRTACSGCTACPGFRVLFRSSDANDPEVMFFCSLCGCRADQHKIDATWQAEEERRKAAEAAAAHMRPSRASSNAAAAVAARQAEADAYAALGLPLGADAKSVARAYKRQALLYHPDKQAAAASAAAGSDGAQAAGAARELAAAAASARFLRITAAYKLLTSASA